MRRVPHTFKKRAPALDQIEVQNLNGKLSLEGLDFVEGRF
jgi:hypothetical protein